VTTKPKALGQLLIETRAVSREVLEEALDRQVGSGRRIGAVLVEGGWTDEEAVARCLALQLNLPYQAPPLLPAPDALALVQPELASKGRVLPLRVSARKLKLAMADPLDLDILGDVQFQCGLRVEPVVASPTAVAEALSPGPENDLQGLLDELPQKWRGSCEEEAETLERAARSGPVVRLVDHVLARAVQEGASDIHIEEHRGEVRIRYRLDGVLRRIMGLPPESLGAVISRLKVMAGMDISVKRRPQDGGMRLENGDTDLALRVSSLPVKHGEKAVVRILDPKRAPWSLEELGLSADDLERIRRVMKGNQGVLLAAGPTGSGKSSTLFAALREVDRDGRNLVTLEDPVEYRLEGANQVQVNPKAGLTFPAALRSVLRQDPDVIMVGEIRDRETAEIAMAAAVTGHLVLSTIHTVDAPGAITRLLNMGVPAYLVAGGLAGVVAQRLIRRLCPGCGGRKAEVTDALRAAVVRGAELSVLRRLAREAGMASMREDALRKAAEGVTSPHEVGRVVQGHGAVSIPCAGCDGEVPLGSPGCPWCGREQVRSCFCGQKLDHAWRYCPSCRRPAGRG
jgi:type IV pilus assembly protein PilB